MESHMVIAGCFCTRISCTCNMVTSLNQSSTRLWIYGRIGLCSSVDRGRRDIVKWMSVYSGLRVSCVMTERQFNTILLFVLLLYFLLIKTQDRKHTHFQQQFCTNSAPEVSTGHNQSAGPTFVFLLLSYNIHKEHLFLINHYCPSCGFSASCRALSSL